MNSDSVGAELDNIYRYRLKSPMSERDKETLRDTICDILEQGNLLDEGYNTFSPEYHTIRVMIRDDLYIHNISIWYANNNSDKKDNVNILTFKCFDDKSKADVLSKVEYSIYLFEDVMV